MNAPNIVQVIDETQDRFSKFCPEWINFEKEKSFAIQHLANNDYLKNAALQNTQSLQRAVVNVAAIGLSLNPAEKLAYLIPRNVKVGNNQWETRVFLEPSYVGLCKLATDSGVIEWIQARPVYENDAFIDNGVGEKPTHEYQAFKPRGEFVGVYCCAKLKTGDYLTEIMDAEAVYSIRERSESWKRSKSGPWATDFIEQARKTVVRRAYKMWPRSDGMDRLHHAIDLSNENEGFEPIVSSPALGQYTAQQKAYFDGLIEKNDALGMFVFQDSLCGSDASSPGASVYISLTHSFPKGEKGKYRQLVEMLVESGRAQFNDYLPSFEAMTQNDDVDGVRELLAELSQEAQDHILKKCSPDTASYIRSVLEQEAA